MPKNKKDEDKTPRVDMSVLGSTGLAQFGGVIDEEWHPKLRGDYGPKVYREMSDNSSTLGAALLAIESLLRQVEYRVEPATETPEGEEWAQFVEECLLDTEDTFDDFVAEVLSELIYGWSYFEVVYKLRKGLTGQETTHSKYNDGRVGWRDIALRSQDSLDMWEIDERGKILGMHQWDVYSGKKAFIPIEKALHFRVKKTKNNPQGRSLLRNAAMDYWYYKRICKVEAIGIERDMAGMPVMEVPVQLLHANASATDKTLLTQLQTLLAQLKADERGYAIIPSSTMPDGNPSGFKFELLSTGGRRAIDTSEVKRFYKINMLQSLLAQFIELGMSGVGSLALASSSTDFFALAMGSIVGSIVETFNRQAIDRLMQINGVPVEHWPKLVHGDLEDIPLADMGAYIQSLATAGKLPEDDAVDRKLLEIAHLPVPSVADRKDGDMGMEMEPKPEAEPPERPQPPGGNKSVLKTRFVKAG